MRKLTYLLLGIFLISNVYAISWSGGTTNLINQTLIGNITIINGNLSELEDVNIPSPSNNEILAFNSTSNNWTAQTFDFLNTIWKRIGNIISPVNPGDNLNMSGGNVSADYYFGDGSKLTGINASGSNGTTTIETNISINYGANESSGESIPFALTSSGVQKWDVPSVASGIWQRIGNIISPDNSGDSVGIGTSSPTHKLNVVGDSNFTENATFQKDVIISGMLYGGSPVKVMGGMNISGGNSYFEYNLSVASLDVRDGDTFLFAGTTWERYNNTYFGVEFTGVKMDDDFSAQSNHNGSLIVASYNTNSENSSNAIFSAVNNVHASLSGLKFSSNSDLPNLGVLSNSGGKFKILQQRNESDSLTGIELGFMDRGTADVGGNAKGFANENIVMKIFENRTIFYNNVSISGDLDVNGNLNVNDVFNINDGTNDRLKISNAVVESRSNNGLSWESLYDTQYQLTINGGTKLDANTLNTRLTGKGGRYLLMDDTAITLNDGTNNRLKADSSETVIYSPNTGAWIGVNNVFGIMSGTGFGKVTVSSEGVSLISPNQTNMFKLNNTDTTITNNLTVADTGFFGWLGSAVNRITELFVVDINASGNVDVQGNITVDGDLNVSTINGRSAKRMVAFAGEIDATVTTENRKYRYGDSADGNFGVVMPLPGTVTFLTVSNGNNTIQTNTLWKNDVSTSATVNLTNENRSVSEVSVTFSAGDSLQMKFTSGTGKYPVATFFVEFDD